MERFPQKSILLILLCLTAIIAKAQVATQYVWWNRLDVTIKLPHNISFTGEVHERVYVSPIAQHQLLFRGTATYNLKHGWNTYTGYTYFLQSPNDPEAASNLIIPEHRLHHGFTNKQTLKPRFAIVQRYQWEERFFHNSENGELTPGYFFVFRARYRILLETVIINKEEARGDLVLKVSNEIHLQAGKTVRGQPFDQNRVLAILQYHLTENLSADFYYINWYQMRSGNQGFFNRHIFGLGLSAQISTKKKKA